MRHQPPFPHALTQLLSKASQAVADAKTVEEIKNVGDKAETVRRCVQNVNLALQMQNHAAESKLRAEREVGAALAAIRFHGGNRRSSSRGENVRLADLGVDHNESARWQREAAVPELEFERYVRESMAANKAISVTGLLRAAKRLGPTNGKKNKQPSRPVTVVAHRWTNGAVSAVPDDPERGELVRELRDHRDVLESLLDPVLNDGLPRLRREERVHANRLLKEMDNLLTELERLLNQPHARTC